MVPFIFFVVILTGSSLLVMSLVGTSGHRIPNMVNYPVWIIVPLGWLHCIDLLTNWSIMRTRYLENRQSEFLPCCMQTHTHLAEKYTTTLIIICIGFG